MDRSLWMKVGAVASVCAVLGAAGGIVGSAAAPSSDSDSKAQSRSGSDSEMRRAPRGHRHGLRLGVGGPPVHSEAVVPNEDGDAFETVTSDSGKVKSVSGSELTVTTGTDDADYKDVTIDVADNAVIRRNGRKSELSDLKAGDRVHVLQAPSRTVVMAQDAATAKRMRDRLRRFRPGHGDRMGPPPGPNPEMRGFGGPPPMG